MDVLEKLNSTNIVVDVDWVLKNGDPRVKFFPLMSSPIPTFVTVILFLTYIKIVGPAMMKNRQPYSLRTPMLLYNIVLVSLSGWMFYRFAAYGWFSKYSWRCEPLDFSNEDSSVKIMEAFYVYYLSKFIEFLDTIFFVLRKKNSQITFLHVFHHSFMPISTWYLVKYGCNGYVTILPLANTFAHIFMYSYYLLSSCGPSVQKYLWWKKHITDIQMIQFIVIMAETGQIMISPPEYCKARFFSVGLTFFHGFIFFILFSKFYMKEYLNKKPVKKDK